MTRSLTFASLLLLGLGLTIALPKPISGASDSPLEVSSAHGPVVVELFTSQGCSSCPPADRLFGRLEGDVIALSFHVDYWNHLGWQDPFSNERWSQRQRQYGRVLRPRGYIYTPQLVIDGQTEAVGSDEREIRKLLTEAAARPRPARVALEVERAGSSLKIAVQAEMAGDAGGSSRLFVAVTEDGLETSIPSGENARRTLAYHHVVRELHAVGGGEIQPGGGSGGGELVIDLDPAWRSERLAVVAFVQDEKSLAVHGAASWRS
ncbi:MAG: DUF1223 domain-containing protein [Acidobacteriota bacterium]